MQKFRMAFAKYRTAHKNCQKLSGGELDDALDAEAAALAELVQTRSATLGQIIQKICVLRDLMRTEWSDGRDLALLQSIYRDLRHGLDRAGAAIAHTAARMLVPAAIVLHHNAALKLIFMAVTAYTHHGVS
jgi:hypothetical protein